MCGICGALVTGGRWSGERLTGLRLTMSAALRHRGPDAHGHHEERGVFLDVNRLSIVDVAGGAQPLRDERDELAAAFNGEIYNHGELRAALERRGHRLRSASDGEVIPHLYEELGPDFARELDGMFAIAVWDRRRRRMVLARDRFGEKPLYLAGGEGDVFFASEMGALVAGGLTAGRISPQAIDDYLSLRYVPGPATVYEDVRELPPGCVACIEAGRVTHRRYWHLAFRPGPPADVEAAAAALRDGLAAGVARVLQGERDAGLLLSGGLDSSSVAVAAVAAGRRPPAYTVRYRDCDDAEGAHAARAAGWLGVPSRPVWLDAGAGARLLPEAAAALDQPNGDQSLVGLFAVARAAAADGVVVLLGGDGADELLAGYRYYGRELRRRSSGRGPLTALPRSDRLTDDFRSMSRWDAAEVNARIYSREMREAVDPVHHLALIAEAAAPDPPTFLEQMLLVDLRMWLPGALLSKADRVTMAHGVELRSPYLAAPVAGLALALPLEARLRRGSGKHVLKRAMRGLLPDWVRHHPKSGFVPPTGAWLRAGPVHDLARDVLASRALRETGWFDAGQVRRLLDEHAAGLHDHDDLLWALLVLGLWLSHHPSPLALAGEVGRPRPGGGLRSA